jgi:hypothetical protein
MTVLAALEQIPVILEAKFSGRVSKAINLITQYEKNTSRSEFSRNELDHDAWKNRLWLIFRMMQVPLWYLPAKWYAQKLFRLAELSHYVASSSATDQDIKEQKVLSKSLKAIEPLFPKIARTLSTYQAQQGWWF